MSVDVSIIIPVYNVEKYLNECLDSLLVQTNKSFEIIAINDGSKDNSLKILETYKDKFENIKIISQENSGLSQSRNNGINEAIGKYILFLDSDDLLTINAIEKLYSLGIENNLDLIIYDALAFDDISGKKNYSKYSRKTIYNKAVMSIDEYLEGAYRKSILASTLHLYKTEILKRNDIRFKNGILHEDEHFSMTSYQYIKKVGYISDKLYLRRYRSNSIMTGDLYSNNKSLESYKWILNEFINIRNKNGTSIYLKKLIDIRSSLILSNLIRYKKFTSKDLKRLSIQLGIKINYPRVIANIIIYKIIKR